MAAVQRIVPFGITIDPTGSQPILLLKTAEDNRFLPVSVGQGEAMAILSKLEGREPARPMTHDLIIGMLAELDAEIVRVTVTELRDDVFRAALIVRADQREMEFDSRPSDALALAVRAGAPMYAEDDVIEENAVDVDLADDAEAETDAGDAEQEVVEDFRRFLDDVTPEDFET
jgi:bifunctional DNase/RNase